MGAEVEVYRTGLPREATDDQLKDEFRRAQEAARHERGHGGYSGTIAEAQGLAIRRELTFAKETEVYKNIFEFAAKWGPAVAVICDEAEGFVFAGVYSS